MAMATMMRVDPVVRPCFWLDLWNPIKKQDPETSRNLDHKRKFHIRFTLPKKFFDIFDMCPLEHSYFNPCIFSYSC